MRGGTRSTATTGILDLAWIGLPAVLGLLAAGLPGLLAGAVAGVACLRFARVRRARLADAALDTALLSDLPDALELIAAALVSGAPTGRAVAVVAAHVASPLGPVLSTACRQADDPAGPPLSVAIRAGRPAVLRPLAACLSASEELGTPLAPALRVLAQDERERRRVAIRTQIARVSPRVTLVVSTVLAPASLILIVGAQALTMAQAFRGG